MAGALTSAPQASPQSAGAAGALAYAGLPPDILAMLTGATGSAPTSPLAQRLSDLSGALIPDSKEIVGALQHAREGYDTAAEQKAAAIRRAMETLQHAANPQGNLPEFVAGSAMMAPTRTGRFGESLSNSGMAYADQIAKQREIERQMAETLGKLDISAADVGQDTALQDVGFLDKQLGMSGQFANQASQAQSRADLAAARTAGVVARINAAQVSANKGRFKYLGRAQDDPTSGMYMDTQTGQTVAGPAIIDKAASGLTPEDRFADDVATEEGKIAMTIPGMNMDANALHDLAIEHVRSARAATNPGGASPSSASPKPKPSDADGGKVSETVRLAQARSAIARGASPDAVKKTLKALGIDPTKLGR